MFRNNFSSSASLAWLLTFSAASSSLHERKQNVPCYVRPEANQGWAATHPCDAGNFTRMSSSSMNVSHV